MCSTKPRHSLVRCSPRSRHTRTRNKCSSRSVSGWRVIGVSFRSSGVSPRLICPHSTNPTVRQPSAQRPLSVRISRFAKVARPDAASDFGRFSDAWRTPPTHAGRPLARSTALYDPANPATAPNRPRSGNPVVRRPQPADRLRGQPRLKSRWAGVQPSRVVCADAAAAQANTHQVPDHGWSRTCGSRLRVRPNALASSRRVFR